MTQPALMLRINQFAGQLIIIRLHRGQRMGHTGLLNGNTGKMLCLATLQAEMPKQQRHGHEVRLVTYLSNGCQQVDGTRQVWIHIG